MGQIHTIGAHKTAILREDDGSIAVVYHSTTVVAVDPDGRITLDSGGWQTPTTKTRINQAANQWRLRFSVFQEAHKWYVNLNDTGEVLDFTDGMVLPL